MVYQIPAAARKPRRRKFQSVAIIHRGEWIGAPGVLRSRAERLQWQDAVVELVEGGADFDEALMAALETVLTSRADYREMVVAGLVPWLGSGPRPRWVVAADRAREAAAGAAV